MSEQWTCEGSVRGGCGITHRSEAAADKCCAADQRGCARVGGYSDRVPTRLDSGDGECQCGSPLVYDEIDEVWRCQANGNTVGHYDGSLPDNYTIPQQD